eukprot:3371953-Amphidinium_carterae.1
MRSKDHHSLDHRGALGKFIMINYFGDGETTLVTDRSGIWEEKTNEYDALDSFEATDDPLLAPPPLYDHRSRAKKGQICTPTGGH